MCKGFIRLPRRIFETRWWTDTYKTFTEPEALIDLYKQANARDRTEPDGTKILRNQFATSNRTLADKWHWPPMKVNRFLKRLEEDNWITVTSCKARTIITIIDFGADTSDTPTDTLSDTPSDTPTDTPKCPVQRGFRGVGDTHSDTLSDTQGDTPSDTYNKNIRNKEYNISPLTPKGYESYDLSFIEDSFRDTFFSWLDYKRERKEKYKSARSLVQCYKNLKKLSSDNPDTAKQIVEQSIGNNWAGLFQLRQQYGTGSRTFNGNQTGAPSNQQLVADTYDLINKARAREAGGDNL